MDKRYTKTKKGYIEVAMEGAYCLYKKEGRKYVAVEFYFDHWDYYAKGHYLVSILDNGRSITGRIFPDKIGLQAAIKEKEKEMLDIVSKKLAMRPAKKLVTKRQKKAWESFEKEMGTDRFICEYAALAEITEAITECLCK